MKSVDEVLEFMCRIDTSSIAYELKKLRAIRAWAMRRLGVDYVVGDRVAIAKVVVSGSSSGWWPYREALAPGALAVVQDIDYNTLLDEWDVAIQLDREWSVHERHGGGTVRFWNGAFRDTPEGMEPPSKYDRENSPEGRRHAFTMRVTDIRKYVEPVTDVCNHCGGQRTAECVHVQPGETQ